ncbi:MAG: lanthionine synthetase LanC family protein [Bacteroidaceae bacterium]|nr:hypothetical protein [Prevotellaceae bacterium]MDY5632708.1 lanthionine synthetase LanC family protein [Bacteroidaceae bacterium]
MKSYYEIYTAKNTIRELVYYVMLNGQLVEDFSFYNGKSGIALSLFEASRFLNDQTIEDYAYDLLSQSLLFQSTDISLETGLAGIGFVLEYLIQNKFIESNPKEIFNEQHEKIVHTFLQYDVIKMNIDNLASIWPIASYLYVSGENRTKKQISSIKEMEMKNLYYLWKKAKSNSENKEYLTEILRGFLKNALFRSEIIPNVFFQQYTSLVKEGIFRRDVHIQFYMSSIKHSATNLFDNELHMMLKQLSLVDRIDTKCLFKEPYLSQHNVRDYLCKKFFASRPQDLDEILSVIVMGKGNPTRLSFGLAGLILGLIAIHQGNHQRLHNILSII